MYFSVPVIFNSEGTPTEAVQVVLQALTKFDVEYCFTGLRCNHPESDTPDELIIFMNDLAPHTKIRQWLIDQGWFVAVEGVPTCLFRKGDTDLPFLSLLQLSRSRDFEEEQHFFGVGLERLSPSGAPDVLSGKVALRSPGSQWHAVTFTDLLAIKLLAWADTAENHTRHGYDACCLMRFYLFLENEFVLDALPDIQLSEEEMATPDTHYFTSLRHWLYVLGSQVQAVVAEYGREDPSIDISAVVRAAVGSPELAVMMSVANAFHYHECVAALDSFLSGMQDEVLPF